jgi:predicted nucleic acid-binding protein
VSVFCDTSVLIRYFAEDDVPRAAAVARLIDSGVELVVSTGVVLETLHVLRTQHGLTNPALADLFTTFLSHDRVSVSDADKAGLLGALAWTRGVSARRVADAIIVSAAARAGVDAIVTFDEAMSSPSVPIRLL